MYYILDHPNPANLELKKYWAWNGYPYVMLSSHLEHAFSLPQVVLTALTMRRTKGHPSMADLKYVFAFMVLYVAGSHVNKAATGAWVVR